MTKWISLWRLLFLAPEQNARPISSTFEMGPGVYILPNADVFYSTTVMYNLLLCKYSRIYTFDSHEDIMNRFGLVLTLQSKDSHHVARMSHRLTKVCPYTPQSCPR